MWRSCPILSRSLLQRLYELTVKRREVEATIEVASWRRHHKHVNLAGYLMTETYPPLLYKPKG